MKSKDLIEACVQRIKDKGSENACLGDFRQYQDLINGLKLGDISLLDTVECLGPQLTNTDVKERVTGIWIFAEIIQNVPFTKLREEEHDYLIKFCCDRLKDQHLVIPHVVRSLVILTSHASIPEGCGSLIVKTLFHEINTQTLTQSTRQGIYIVLATVLQKSLTELQDIGPDFVVGFIQAIDGEKDPRNLMMIFQTVPYILKNFKLGFLAEEFFEVISCYFPIDFSPPANNPHGVTKEDLISSLRMCLVATPAFSSFCLPLLIEKLDSSITDAKIDSLQTLAACCETYDINEIRKHFSSIWSSIRREILLGANEIIEQEGLAALTAVIKAASTSVIKADGKSILEEFLQEICAECEKYLCEPELKLMYPSAGILQAAARASDLSCQKVLLNAIPLLMQQYTTRRVSQNNEVSTQIATVVNLYMTLLQSDEECFAEAALIGFDTMLKVPALLSSAACNLLVKHFLVICFTHRCENVRKLNLLTLKTVATLHTDKAENQILPKLMTEITVENHEATYYNAFDAVGAICIRESMAKTAIPKLIDHLNSLLTQNDDQSVKRIKHCINCIGQVIKNIRSQQETSYVFDLILIPLTRPEIIKKLSSMKDSMMISQIATLFDDITTMLSASKTESLLQTFVYPILFSNLNSFDSYDTLHLMSAIICSAPGKAFGRDIKTIISQLDNLIKDSLNENTLFLVQMTASIVNKYEDGIQLNDVITMLRNSVDNKLNEKCSRVKGLTLLIWVSKALILRGHPTTEMWINKLIDLLSDDQLGLVAANGFDLITRADEEFSTERNAVIRLMYRQQLYQMSISKLLSGFSVTENNDYKSHYLIAVLHQLHYLPQQVLHQEINSLIPLLSKGIIFNADANLLLTTLNTLIKVISEFPSAVEKHITSLIPHFIRLARSGSSLKIRTAALHCLNASCKQPTYVILPIKNDVIKELTQCLDDRKRLVRQIAVITRGNWFLVGAPGGSN